MSYEIILPELNNEIEQDEEWLVVNFGDRREKLRFHDYGALYKIPGLYEKIFYDHLKCNSPYVLCEILNNVVDKTKQGMENLRVLDFGAGNGIVGEELSKRGYDLLVGVDILSEAKDAVKRDRPGIYDDYFVANLSRVKGLKAKKLKKYRFNTLISVAALGFDDIPTRAFLNAFNLIKNGGLVAFNIKERFLTDEDNTGYGDIIKSMDENYFKIHRRKNYCHRLSTSGEKLYYTAIVGRKVKNVKINKMV